jgi:hypothetical protein
MKRIRKLTVTRAFAAAALAALIATATATAAVNEYKVQMTADGNAVARGPMLKPADIGDEGVWTGGPTKTNTDFGLSCPNYKPKLSKLVIIGAARVKYKQPGISMVSNSQVFRTPRMVELDWQRTAASPKFLACIQATFKKSSTKSERFVSFKRLDVPKIGPFTIAFRTVYDFATVNGRERVAVDTVSFARGRTEVALTTTMPATSIETIYPNELVLAKQLAYRIID